MDFESQMDEMGAAFAATVVMGAVVAARQVGAEEEETRLQLEALRAVVPLEVLRRALDSATRAPTT